MPLAILPLLGGVWEGEYGVPGVSGSLFLLLEGSRYFSSAHK